MMLRKSALSALGASSNGVAPCTARRIACSLQQQRTFMSSPQRNATITHFTPASTPALDSLLDEIRTKIILPSYLPLAQRKKIHAKRYQKQLENDPITIEIDGEVLKFRYVDPHTSMPTTSKAVMKAIESFTTPEDFNNFKPLIEGLANARRHFSVNFYPKLVRRFGDRGRIYDIIEAARSVKTTNFKLGQPEVALELLFHIQLKAQQAGFEEAQTKQSLRWTEMVYDMLHKQEHQVKHEEAPDNYLIYRDPLVLLNCLHLRAQLAARHDTSPGAVEEVRKFGQDIVNLWAENVGTVGLQSASVYAKNKMYHFIMTPSKFVTLTTPMLAGLDAAVKVLAEPHPQLASELQTRRDSLAQDIQKNRASAKGGRGEDTYLSFFPE